MVNMAKEAAQSDTSGVYFRKAPVLDAKHMAVACILQNGVCIIRAVVCIIRHVLCIPHSGL